MTPPSRARGSKWTPTGSPSWRKTDRNGRSRSLPRQASRKAFSTGSRRPLSEARRRYLELQRALGGNEIILTQESLRGAEGPEAIPTGSPRPSGPRDDRESTSRPAAQPSSRPSKHWSTDAPPIPTVPGIVVPALLEAPSPWSTLEEVAATIAGCRQCFRCDVRARPALGGAEPEALPMFVGLGRGRRPDDPRRASVRRHGARDSHMNRRVS